MKWVVVTVSALLIGLLAYGVVAQDKRNGTSSIDNALQRGTDGAAPKTDLPRLGAAGKTDLTAYRGKVVLVNFWASWCKPCTAEMPALQQLQTTMAAKGGTVLGIASRDNSDDALRFMRRFKVTYPNLRDGSGDTAEAWGVYKQPESFLLDKQGKVVAHAIGAVDQQWIDRNVTPLLS